MGLTASLCLKQFSTEEIKSEKFHDDVAFAHDGFVRKKIVAARLYFMKLYLCLTCLLCLL